MSDISIEHLLKPRFKVIADYYQGRKEVSDNPIKIGDVFMNQMPQQNVVWRRFIEGIWDVQTIHNPQQYPHLFRKLEWWEERDGNEMPGYVRYAENGKVAKVDRFDLETTSAWFMFLNDEPHPYCPGGSALANTNWLPATEQEYLDFINKKP